jgi:hypothetical protein
MFLGGLLVLMLLAAALMLWDYAHSPLDPDDPMRRQAIVF